MTHEEDKPGLPPQGCPPNRTGSSPDPAGFDTVSDGWLHLAGARPDDDRDDHRNRAETNFDRADGNILTNNAPLGYVNNHRDNNHHDHHRPSDPDPDDHHGNSTADDCIADACADDHDDHHRPSDPDPTTNNDIDIGRFVPSVARSGSLVVQPAEADFSGCSGDNPRLGSETCPDVVRDLAGETDSSPNLVPHHGRRVRI